MSEEIDEKVKYIIETESEISGMVEDTISKRMKNYREKYGFTQVDERLWLSLSLRPIVCIDVIKNALEYKMDKKD